MRKSAHINLILSSPMSSKVTGMRRIQTTDISKSPESYNTPEEPIAVRASEIGEGRFDEGSLQSDRRKTPDAQLGTQGEVAILTTELRAAAESMAARKRGNSVLRLLVERGRVTLSDVTLETGNSRTAAMETLSALTKFGIAEMDNGGW